MGDQSVTTTYEPVEMVDNVEPVKVLYTGRQFNYEFEMIGPRILVKRWSEESFGDIELPDSAKEHATMGVIVATGNQVYYLKQGDRVLFAQFSGNQLDNNVLLDVRDEMRDVYVMLERDILAKVEVTERQVKATEGRIINGSA